MKLLMLIGIGCALVLPLGNAHSADIAAGEAKYASNCAQCHGRTGRGAGAFPSVTGKTQEHHVERLTRYREGERIGPNTALMAPNARNLSDEDIADLAAFMATTFR